MTIEDIISTFPQEQDRRLYRALCPSCRLFAFVIYCAGPSIEV